MTTKININGNIQDDGFISVFDHGFLFGDSVYEVICARHPKTYFAERHLSRLRSSAKGIALAIPHDDEWFLSEIARTVRAAGNENSYIRIVVTRGIGDIDIDPSSCGRANVILYVTKIREYPREYYDNGINIALVSVKRNPREALNPGIKTGNYLNNVLAKMEASRLGAKDALMLNPFGYLTECTTSNFFFVRDGQVFTPALDCGILAGITRDIVIQLARENGISVEEGQWPAEELDRAEEMFLTGTLKELMPVTQMNGKKIGDGKPGLITRRLMRLYQSLLESL